MVKRHVLKFSFCTRAEAALLVDAAKSAADADEGRRLQAEGEKLHGLLAAYSESDEGQAALAEARAKIAALHDDRTLELARACQQRSQQLVQQVLASAEGQELLARQEHIIAQLSALKENEDAQAIVALLRQRSSSMMRGAIDTKSWAHALHSVDTQNLTAERVASEAEQLVDKLQQNEHVKQWLQRNQALLGDSLSSAQTNALLLKSQTFLSDALSPELVNSALRQGLELHTQFADQLAPDALARNAHSLLTDRAARDVFVRQVKVRAMPADVVCACWRSIFAECNRTRDLCILTVHGWPSVEFSPPANTIARRQFSHSACILQFPLPRRTRRSLFCCSSCQRSRCSRSITTARVSA